MGRCVNKRTMTSENHVAIVFVTTFKSCLLTIPMPVQEYHVRKTTFLIQKRMVTRVSILCLLLFGTVKNGLLKCKSELVRCIAQLNMVLQHIGTISSEGRKIQFMVILLYQCLI